MLKKRFLGIEEERRQEELEQLQVEKEKQLRDEKKGFDLDVYQQIDQYIQVKTGKVDPDTIAVYENMKSHVESFEKYRNEPISFDSFDFNFMTVSLTT